MVQEFDLTATQKGAIGETLLTTHKSAIRDYFADWCLNDLEENSPEWVPDVDYRITFDTGKTPHSYDASIDGDYATWYPDTLYEMRFTPATPRKESNR